MMFKRVRRWLTLLSLALLAGGAILFSNHASAEPPSGKGGGKDNGAPPPPSISYSITRLGTLGGSYSMGRGMNSFGEVVGASETDRTEAWHTVLAYVYTAAAGIRDLDDLSHKHPTDPTIDPNLGWVLTVANDINDAGQIVGQQSYRDDDLDGQIDRGGVAFRYTPGTATAPPVVEELLGLGAPGDNPRPMAINDDGDAAGHAVALDGLWHAVLWTAEGNVFDLGTLAGKRVQGWAVNDRDGDGMLQVAGWADTNDGRRAWRWTGNTLGEGVMKDLGHFEVAKNRVPRVEAYDMNNLGQVVGFSSMSRTGSHAFRYSDGAGIEDLGGLTGGSSANGINFSGDVVGLAGIKTDGHLNSVGFVFTDEFGMLELEPLIVDLPTEFSGQIDPWRINDAGQICGPYSDNFNFSGEAFLLTPLP